MKLIVAAAALLLLTGCSSFESDTADLPGSPSSRAVLGELICGELDRGRDAGSIADDFDGEIFTADEALQLTVAADRHLC